MRIFRTVGGAVVLIVAGHLTSDALDAQAAPDYTIRQLSPPGEPASRVSGAWAVDPRGEWVAFVGDVESAGADAVYAMRRNGSDLHRLSPLSASGAIAELAFSPDGRRVLYRGDLEVDGLGEIWSVAPWESAAAAVKLNGALTGAGALYFRVPGWATGWPMWWTREPARRPGVCRSPVPARSACGSIRPRQETRRS